MSERIAGILTLIGLVAVVLFIVLGVLTILWIADIIEMLLGIKIPWYVRFFVCLAFILSAIKVTIVEHG